MKVFLLLTTLGWSLAACGGDHDASSPSTNIDTDTDSTTDDTSGDAPVILPGSGWSGLTAEPGPVGNPSDSGYDAKVIGHWDVVPHQIFTDSFEVGVVAFHINGIDRVEFAVEGGPWVPVTEMTLNPRTNVWEYWAVLRASDFPDGPVVVRGIAYPKSAGEPRLLEYNYLLNDGGVTNNLLLYADSGDTLDKHVRYVSTTGDDETGDGSMGNPFATISHSAEDIEAAQGGDAGGGTIYLLAGDHNLDAPSGVFATNRWLTISGAPGTTRQAVRLTTGGGSANTWFETKLRLHELTMVQIEALARNDGGALWGDHIDWQGVDEFDKTKFSANYTPVRNGIYSTESSFKDGYQPFDKTHLLRNLTFENIGADLLRSPRLAVNIASTNHGYAREHSDFCSFWPAGAAASAGISTWENFIFFNIVSYDAEQITQGIYVDGLPGGGLGPFTYNNLAFVNIHHERESSGNSGGQLRETTSNHVLLWNITYDNLLFSIVGDSTITNCSVRGCCWDRLNLDLASGVTEADFESNHYRDTNGFTGGADATVGDPGWADPAEDDYRPGPNSVLRDRLSDTMTPIDAKGVKRTVPADVGAFESQ